MHKRESPCRFRLLFLFPLFNLVILVIATYHFYSKTPKQVIFFNVNKYIWTLLTLLLYIIKYAHIFYHFNGIAENENDDDVGPLLTGRTHRTGAPIRVRISQVFTDYDADGDGHIDTYEMLAVSLS